MFQLGKLIAGGGFGVGTIAAIIVLAFLLYMLLRKSKYTDEGVLAVSAVAAAK